MNDFWIKLQGNSMFPILRDQDEIYIQSLKFDQVQRGDVLLFIDQQTHELTLHRLVSFPMITKGDFSRACENNSPEYFLGKALLYKRGMVIGEIVNSQWILNFSKMRLSPRPISYLGFFGLCFFSIYLQLYNAKTRLSHNKKLVKESLS